MKIRLEYAIRVRNPLTIVEVNMLADAIAMGIDNWLDEAGPEKEEGMERTHPTEIIASEAMKEMESGWQIGIYPEDEEPATQEEERTAMRAVQCIPEENIDNGVWIASIPTEWAKAAQVEEHTEPGKLIQECNRYTIINEGRKWIIEIPMP